MYKHHITHLEDIYLNHKFDISQKTHQVIQTPVTQLYGINGLKSNLPKQKTREREKESGWVANFQKYRALEPKRSRRPRIKPPVFKQDNKAASAPGDTPSEHVEYNPLEISEEDLAAEQQMQMRRRTRAPHLTSDELVLLGMYKFNPEQEEIYQKFVSMLTEFDKFDMVSRHLNSLFCETDEEGNGGGSERDSVSANDPILVALSSYSFPVLLLPPLR